MRNKFKKFVIVWTEAEICRKQVGLQYEENNKKGISVSAITLGTVQLGLDYGISNTHEKPDRAKVFEILNCAAAYGINTFDTAAAYGNAEEVVGAWLQQRSFAEPSVVVTKVHALDHSSLSASRGSIQQKVQEAKQKLGTDCLPLLMLHHCEEYLQDEARVYRVFEELKDAGDI